MPQIMFFVSRRHKTHEQRQIWAREIFFAPTVINVERSSGATDFSNVLTTTSVKFWFVFFLFALLPCGSQQPALGSGVPIFVRHWILISGWSESSFFRHVRSSWKWSTTDAMTSCFLGAPQCLPRFALNARRSLHMFASFCVVRKLCYCRFFDTHEIYSMLMNELPLYEAKSEVRRRCMYVSVSCGVFQQWCNNERM